MPTEYQRLTPSEASALRRAQSEAGDLRSYKRLTAVLLFLETHLTQLELRGLLSVGQGSISRWLAAYQASGRDPAALIREKQRGPRSPAEGTGTPRLGPEEEPEAPTPASDS
jgi:hypothetical protein